MRVLGTLIAEVRLAELALDTETLSEAGVSAAQVQVGMASGLGGHPFCAMKSALSDLLATCAWPRFAAMRDLVDQTLDPCWAGLLLPEHADRDLLASVRVQLVRQPLEPCGVQ